MPSLFSNHLQRQSPPPPPRGVSSSSSPQRPPPPPPPISTSSNNSNNAVNNPTFHNNNNTNSNNTASRASNASSNGGGGGGGVLGLFTGLFGKRPTPPTADGAANAPPAGARGGANSRGVTIDDDSDDGAESIASAMSSMESSGSDDVFNVSGAAKGRRIRERAASGATSRASSGGTRQQHHGGGSGRGGAVDVISDTTSSVSSAPHLHRRQRGGAPHGNSGIGGGNNGTRAAVSDEEEWRSASDDTSAENTSDGSRSRGFHRNDSSSNASSSRRSTTNMGRGSFQFNSTLNSGGAGPHRNARDSNRAAFIVAASATGAGVMTVSPPEAEESSTGAALVSAEKEMGESTEEGSSELTSSSLLSSGSDDDGDSRSSNASSSSLSNASSLSNSAITYVKLGGGVGSDDAAAAAAKRRRRRARKLRAQQKRLREGVGGADGADGRNRRPPTAANMLAITDRGGGGGEAQRRQPSVEKTAAGAAPPTSAGGSGGAPAAWLGSAWGLTKKAVSTVVWGGPDSGGAAGIGDGAVVVTDPMLVNGGNANNGDRPRGLMAPPKNSAAAASMPTEEEIAMYGGPGGGNKKGSHRGSSRTRGASAAPSERGGGGGGDDPPRISAARELALVTAHKMNLFGMGDDGNGGGGGFGGGYNGGGANGTNTNSNANTNNNNHLPLLLLGRPSAGGGGGGAGGQPSARALVPYGGAGGGLVSADDFLLNEEALRADEDAIFPVDVAVPVTFGTAGVIAGGGAGAAAAEEIEMRLTSQFAGPNGNGTTIIGGNGHAQPIGQQPQQPQGPQFMIDADGNLILLSDPNNPDGNGGGVSAGISIVPGGGGGAGGIGGGTNFVGPEGQPITVWYDSNGSPTYFINNTDGTIAPLSSAVMNMLTAAMENGTENGFAGGRGTIVGFVPGLRGLGTRGGYSSTAPHSLLDAIRLYKASPTDYHTNLCLTYLSARGADDYVTAEELSEADRNRFLVKLFIEKGALDFNSPDVIVELQACVDEWIGEDPPKDFFIGATAGGLFSTVQSPTLPATGNSDVSDDNRNEMESQDSDCVPSNHIDGSMAEYLRAVFTTRYVRITAAQQTRLYRSGFEFGKLMYDYPHVVADIPASPLRRAWYVKWARRLQPGLMLLTVGLMAYDHATLGYIWYLWFQIGSAMFQFYLSIIVYVAASVLMALAIYIAIKLKPMSIYSEDGAIVSVEFPSHYLKLFPMLLELQICNTYFRELLRLGHGMGISIQHRSQTPNLFLLHDLWALISLSHTIHSGAVTIVQLLIQSYYYSWSLRDDGSEAYDSVSLGYVLLQTAAWPSLAFTFVIHCLVTSVFYCVTNLGFVRLSTEIEKKSMSIFGRMIGLILLYLFICNVFFLLVAVFNFDSCSMYMIIWVSVAGVVVVFTVIVFSWTVYYSGNIIRAAKWLLPPILCQAAFSVYVSSTTNRDEEGDDCQTFFLVGGSVNIILGYVGWGALIAVVAVWGLLKAIAVYRAMKLRKAAAVERQKAAEEEEERLRIEAGGGGVNGPDGGAAPPRIVSTFGGGVNNNNRDLSLIYANNSNNNAMATNNANYNAVAYTAPYGGSAVNVGGAMMRGGGAPTGGSSRGAGIGIGTGTGTGGGGASSAAGTAAYLPPPYVLSTPAGVRGGGGSRHATAVSNTSTAPFGGTMGPVGVTTAPFD